MNVVFVELFGKSRVPDDLPPLRLLAVALTLALTSNLNEHKRHTVLHPGQRTGVRNGDSTDILVVSNQTMGTIELAF